MVQASEDWVAFHRIQRTALFEQSESEYDAAGNDGFFPQPAERTPLLLKADGTPVAVATLDHLPDGRAVMRSVAVAAEAQRKGHGRVLGELTRDFARDAGCRELCVNASMAATGFYEQLGFAPSQWDSSEQLSPELQQMMAVLERSGPKMALPVKESARRDQASTPRQLSSAFAADTGNIAPPRPTARPE